MLLGATATGTAAVLAAYFGGLALGAWVSGRLADRWRDLRLYAGLEAGVAAALVLYVGVRPLLPLAVVWVSAAVPSPFALAAQVTCAFVVLLLPTVLLGGTLPAASVVLPSGDAAGAGRLYAWNAGGGAAGALACGLLGIRWLGVRGSFLGAASLDAGVAVIACALARRRVERATAAAPGPPIAKRPGAAASVAALCGFAGIAGEVLWSRGLAGVLSNSVYSVSVVLAAVLLGLVGGAWIGVRLVRRPVVLEARLAGALTALATAVWGSVVGLHALPAFSVSLIHLLGVSGPAMGLLVEAALALAVVLLPALALGALFPLALALDGTLHPANSVGRVLAINTAAGICGALAGAFWLLPACGLAGGLLVLAAAAVLLAWQFTAPAPLRGCTVAAAAVIALTAVLAPPLRVPWRASSRDRILFYRDGPTATVAVTADERGAKRLRINGQYSLGGTASVLLEARQSFIPLLLHPAPRHLLTIGVGTGDTVGAALAFPELQATGIELVGGALQAARLFGRENHAVLGNPRARFVAEDARRYLLRNSERYDVILSDLFLPWEAGTANLYSRDFYRLGLSHLQPNGLYCQWLPLHQLDVGDLQAIIATFTDVFPDVTLWVAYHRSLTPLAALVGSTVPPTVTMSALRARFASPEVAPALAAAGLEGPADLAVLYVSSGERLRAATRGVAPITDDRPRLAFTAPAAYFRQSGLAAATLRWIAAQLDPQLPPGLAAVGVPAEARRLLLTAQLALLSGDRPQEFAAYLRALPLAPRTPTTRIALLAIARERLAVGDRQTAAVIGAALGRWAPGTAESAALAGGGR